MGDQRHTQTTLTPGMRHSTLDAAYWLGSTASLYGRWRRENVLRPPEFEPRFAQPVASRYKKAITERP